MLHSELFHHQLCDGEIILFLDSRNRAVASFGRASCTVQEGKIEEEKVNTISMQRCCCEAQNVYRPPCSPPLYPPLLTALFCTITASLRLNFNFNTFMLPFHALFFIIQRYLCIVQSDFVKALFNHFVLCLSDQDTIFRPLVIPHGSGRCAACQR